mmetsp:Transcript_36036/g.91046  ORF Transcript_36036/g.91046 Transcript_36036/m.91046 type:complete len:292 (-) Transcript_36036:1235-2110(-)
MLQDADRTFSMAATTDAAYASATAIKVYGGQEGGHEALTRVRSEEAPRGPVQDIGVLLGQVRPVRTRARQPGSGATNDLAEAAPRRRTADHTSLLYPGSPSSTSLRYATAAGEDQAAVTGLIQASAHTDSAAPLGAWIAPPVPRLVRKAEQSLYCLGSACGPATSGALALRPLRIPPCCGARTVRTVQSVHISSLLGSARSSRSSSDLDRDQREQQPPPPPQQRPRNLRQTQREQHPGPHTLLVGPTLLQGDRAVADLLMQYGCSPPAARAGFGKAASTDADTSAYDVVLC